MWTLFLSFGSPQISPFLFSLPMCCLTQKEKIVHTPLLTDSLWSGSCTSQSHNLTISHLYLIRKDFHPRSPLNSTLCSTLVPSMTTSQGSALEGTTLEGIPTTPEPHETAEFLKFLFKVRTQYQFILHRPSCSPCPLFLSFPLRTFMTFNKTKTLDRRGVLCFLTFNNNLPFLTPHTQESSVSLSPSQQQKQYHQQYIEQIKCLCFTPKEVGNHPVLEFFNCTQRFDCIVKMYPTQPQEFDSYSKELY